MTAPRPSTIEEALAQMHSGQWFGWNDSNYKVYTNLKLTEKVGVNGNILDNPITELPTEEAVNAKLKELQDQWDKDNT